MKVFMIGGTGLLGCEAARIFIVESCVTGFTLK